MEFEIKGQKFNANEISQDQTDKLKYLVEHHVLDAAEVNLSDEQATLDQLNLSSLIKKLDSMTDEEIRQFAAEQDNK